MSLNVFTFTGNLGQDAKLRDAAGTPVSSFSVAVKSGYGDREQTLWIECSWFGQRATGRVMDYLKKGQQVAVTGELGTREYQGKTYLQCRVTSLELIGGKSEKPPVAPAVSTANASKNYDDLDDDIPF